jgi:hypothetical protein
MRDPWYDRDEHNECNLCTPYLKATPGSDEVILGEHDFARFRSLVFHYRAPDDRRPLLDEWLRRDIAEAEAELALKGRRR